MRRAATSPVEVCPSVGVVDVLAEVLNRADLVQIGYPVSFDDVAMEQVRACVARGRAGILGDEARPLRNRGFGDVDGCTGGSFELSCPVIKICDMWCSARVRTAAVVSDDPRSPALDRILACSAAGHPSPPPSIDSLSLPPRLLGVLRQSGVRSGEGR